MIIRIGIKENDMKKYFIEGQGPPNDDDETQKMDFVFKTKIYTMKFQIIINYNNEIMNKND